MSSSLAQLSRLEVERKFVATPQLMTLLQGIGTNSEPQGASSHDRGDSVGALSFFRLPDKRIQDTYYDLEGELAEKGIWIRRRMSSSGGSGVFPLVHDRVTSTKLEAKVRLSGDYADSQFLELEGESSICALLQQHSFSRPFELLKVSADLETHRRTWVVQESPVRCTGGQKTELRIDLDKITAPRIKIDGVADFEHEIGELEMTKEMIGSGEDEAHAEERTKVVEEMRRHVDELISRYSWLFKCTPKPKGKLGAFFEWENAAMGDDQPKVVD